MDAHSFQSEKGLAAATWTDLEFITKRNKSEKDKTYNFTYTWNIKSNTNELIYKTEADS